MNHSEIPVPYVRANQIGIIILVTAALVFGQPILVAALLFVQLITLWLGLQANVFVRLAKPFLASRIDSSPTESAELQRFNNGLAAVFLSLSVVCFALGWALAGYLFAAMLGLAALGAVLGYCLGCTIYYQIKKLRK